MTDSINERIAKAKGFSILKDSGRAFDKPSARVYDYENNIADAWQLVEEMQRENPGWRFCLIGGDTTDKYTLKGGTVMGGFFGWKAELFGHADARQDFGQRHATERADTAGRAICRVWLAVNEDKENG